MDQVFLDFNRHTFILAKVGRKHNHLITMANGSIELVKMSSDRMEVELKPMVGESRQRAAQIYLNSYIDKSAPALRALESILDGVDFEDIPTAPPKPHRKIIIRELNIMDLSQICKSIGMDQSKARRIFRGLGIEKPESGRWEWPIAEVPEIERVLIHGN